MFASPKRSVLISWLLHCGAILLVLGLTGVKPEIIKQIRDTIVYYPEPAPVKIRLADGGGRIGGGGKHELLPASVGDLPKMSRRPFVPPTSHIVNETPILAMEPAILGNADMPVPMLNLKLYGDPNGVRGPASDGRGTGGGIGDGEGTGVGNHNGGGASDVDGDGCCGVGYKGAGIGSVTEPRIVTKVDPEYSEEARKVKLQGRVLLRIVIDTQGHAQNLSVLQPLGLGLDERAMDAVRKWRFLPGKVNGKPTPMAATVELTFRLL